jgi:hypothetical protein
MSSAEKVYEFHPITLLRKSRQFIMLLKWPITLILITVILARYTSPASALHRLNWDIILKYVDTLIWPLVALVAIYFMKPHIPDLMKRVRKFGAFGVQGELDPPSNTPLPTEQKEELKDIEEISAGQDSEDALENTRRILSSPEAKDALDSVYKELYGTQLEALKRLNSYRDGLDSRDLEDLLSEHQRQAPIPYKNILSFMQYLKDNWLVLYEPDTKLFKLTNAGLVFLEHLQDKSLLYAPKSF